MSLATHLAELERKHRTLDSEIERELQHLHADDHKVASLKRKKLQLKDEIVKLKEELDRKTVH
ncbi:MAG: YdcH family protein [Beijerinckiaceae bacterium]